MIFYSIYSGAHLTTLTIKVQLHDNKAIRSAFGQTPEEVIRKDERNVDYGPSEYIGIYAFRSMQGLQPRHSFWIAKFEAVRAL